MARRPGRQGTGAPVEAPALAALARQLHIDQDGLAWLEQALTHRSLTREQGEEERESNERLEFLGDAIVQFVVSRALYDRFPRWTEGQLTTARAAVVSREPLFQAARRLGLGNYLRLARTEEEAGGRGRASILSSAFEAVIAAVYLSSGIETAEEVIRLALKQELATAEITAATADAKTRLQEVCQARFHIAPEYRVMNSTGPQHARIFSVEVFINDQSFGSGEGRNKKDAEQAAAREALRRLES